jgi:hypothetical protein
MKPWVVGLLSLPMFAQDFSQRGFLDTRLALYPQTAPNDSAHVVTEALFRYEASYKLSPGVRFAGSLDARTDSHRQAEREWGVSWWDRGTRRPAFSVRRLSAILHKGPLTAEFGKQFIRWGKADVLNPTDRFAPRDFLSVVDNDFLAVTAARLTWERKSDTIELVYAPRFTPSRIPLLNQRWVVIPAEARGVPIRDAGSRFPGGPQFGARWNHVGSGFEHSLSFYEGFNHLPLIDGQISGTGDEIPQLAPANACSLLEFRCLSPKFEGRLAPAQTPPTIDLQRFFPKMRMYGADAAVPLKWFTVKGEAGYFTSGTPQAGEYLQYVIQLERQTGEWSFVGGYAGEYVTEERGAPDFAPDRGLARAFLGRASYTIDVNRSFAFEGAVRQNGDGAWLKFEYSQALGQHWRATAGFALIRGAQNDFLGQYRRNSHGILALRYSF